MFEWLRRKSTGERTIPGGTEVEFLGEQTGELETRFVRALEKELAAHAGVARAYLARVRYAVRDRDEVALCLVGDGEEAVFDRVKDIFWALFPMGQHLDLFFVTDEEERRLAAVCPPFYEAKAR